MTSTVAVGPAAPDGAGDPGGPTRSERTELSDRVIWWFVAGGIVGGRSLALLLPTERRPVVLMFDACSLGRRGRRGLRHPPQRAAAPGRLAALRPRPRAASPPATWCSTSPSAPSAGPTAIRSPTSSTCAAYPVLAVALIHLARSRFDRETLIDSAIVAVALVGGHLAVGGHAGASRARGATLEHMVTVAYPLMDILLVVVIVHAVFTLPRWSAAAWLLVRRARVDAASATRCTRASSPTAATPTAALLDAVWPIAYFLLAAAVMHPSMRALWEGARRRARSAHGRARMVVLGAALFAAPAVVLLDDSGSSTAVVLAAITGIAALGVAWRITRLRRRVEPGPRRARRERGSLPRAACSTRPTSSPCVTPSGRVKYMSPAVDGDLPAEVRRPSSAAASSTTSTTAGIEQSPRALRDARSSTPNDRSPPSSACSTASSGAGSRPHGPTSSTSRRSAASSATSATSPTASAAAAFTGPRRVSSS